MKCLIRIIKLYPIITTQLDELLREIEKAHPEKYWEFIHELHVMVNGSHFDRELAVFAVSEMVNEDGTKGPHWTIEETNSVATNSSVYFDKFNEYDWFYVMNMIYSDFFKVVGDNLSMYIMLAKGWIMDADAPEGKAFKYWMAMKY